MKVEYTDGEIIVPAARESLVLSTEVDPQFGSDEFEHVDGDTRNGSHYSESSNSEAGGTPGGGGQFLDEKSRNAADANLSGQARNRARRMKFLRGIGALEGSESGSYLTQ